ncbi:MAG: hypothetical protein JWQ17_1191, partial [Tardiphaga sp.]|nr:hypothetical protein [Tardiphaga sp.]
VKNTQVIRRFIKMRKSLASEDLGSDDLGSDDKVRE